MKPVNQPETNPCRLFALVLLAYLLCPWAAFALCYLVTKWINS